MTIGRPAIMPGFQSIDDAPSAGPSVFEGAPRAYLHSNSSACGHAADRRPDVVLTLFTSWAAAGYRGFSYSEDRLAEALLRGDHTRRVLICDSFRSGPRRLANALRGRREPSFPESLTTGHYAPARLGYAHPVSLSGIKRAYTAYERGLRRAARRQGLQRPIVITANPFVAGFCDFKWAGPITYYAWDDWESAEPLRKWWPVYAEAFECLRAKRIPVVMVGESGIQRIRPTGPYAVVPNGIDPAEWQHLPSPPAWFASQPQPRFVYLGSLDSRIDTDQLHALAEAFPTGSITLVGPVTDAAHFATLRQRPNVTFHPNVPRAAIPGLLAHADVGLVPHRRTRFTQSVSRPLKLYEYLAAGRPVAAVATHPGLAGLSDRVLMVEPAGDLVPVVRRALALGPQSELERLSFVAEHSWERRFHELFRFAFAL